MEMNDNENINVASSSLFNIRTERLLNCFDITTRDALLDFCKRISGIEADVFMLMARKATCFFNCLEELGLIHFNGYVTSERVLDMNTDWLFDKSVIIIDDAIVSGTSINRTISKLKKAGVKSIQVHVLSVNERWFQPDMLTDDNGNTYLYPNCNVATNEKCIDLCYEVVKAILLQPRPYDIDYPFFSRINVKTSSFGNITNRLGWNAYDVSTVEQIDNQIYSITLMPSKETVMQFEKFVSCNAFEKCILKIRLYTTFNDKNKKTYSIRVVPIIIFDKIDLKCIEQMFDNLIQHSDKRDLGGQFKSISSKMRLVQYYYSYKLALFWARGLPNSLGVRGNDLALEERNLSFIFPKEIDHEVDELCHMKSPRITMAAPFDFEQNTESERNSKILDKDYIALETRLIEPFVQFYYQKEIPCREIVLKYGKQVFDNREYNDLTQRLNIGINIGELMHIISYANEEYDIKTKVSLFLDRSIDMGIIVPITQENGKYIYRAYRHGEDVLFGEREKILYMYLLKQFQIESKQNPMASASDKDMPIEGVNHISLEKILVLFTKIGLKQKILFPYISNFTCNPKDHCEDVLRVKTTLKGPVALVGPVKKHRSTSRIPYVTTESKMMWFSKVFSSQGLIRMDANNKYHIEDVDTSSILPSDLSKVQDIAILFGQVCNKNVDTGINYGDDELTKISTCLTISDCIKAVSAELYIYLQWWNTGILDRINTVDEEFLNNAKRSPYYEALNSAYMKMNAYESGEAKKLITDVVFASRIEQNQWNMWFDDVYKTQDNSYLGKVCNDLYIECKKLSLFLLMLNNLLLESLFINYKYDTRSRKYKYINDCEQQVKIGYDSLKQMHNDLDDESQVFVLLLEELKNEISSTYNSESSTLETTKKVPDTTIETICSSIDKCVDGISSLLDDVCSSLGNRGHMGKMTIFNQAVAVVYKTDSIEFKECVEKQVNRCYESLIRDITNLGDTKVSILPENYNPETTLYQENERVVWLIASGNNSAYVLATFTMNLLYVVYEECKNRNLQFAGMNVLFMGDISYRYSIKQPELSPSEFFCNAFYDYIDYMPMSLFMCDRNALDLKIAIEQSKYDDNRYVSYVNSDKVRSKASHILGRGEMKEATLHNSMKLKVGTHETKIILERKDEDSSSSCYSEMKKDDNQTSNSVTNNITNNFFAPLNDVQLQQGTFDSNQNKSNNDFLNESILIKIVDLIKNSNDELIRELGTENAKRILQHGQELEDTIGRNEPESKKRKVVEVIKDIATNAIGGVVSAAILNLISTL